MEPASAPTLHFLNVEYFFRLLYELITRPGDFSIQTNLLQFASQVWLLVTAISLILSIIFLWVFVSSVLRYHAVRREEHHRFATLHPDEAETTRDHSRWEHIRELVSRPHDSDWRQAIIEADIMLDDLLSQLGYLGQSVGEKLRAVDPGRFQSLNYAWEAHKVRNRIAHEGTAFPLTEQLAHRTIAMYEVVMREHGEIQ